MVVESFYLSDENNIEVLSELTGLALDEIEEIVGRFRKNHYRFAGKLKGEVIVLSDETVKIRHHFSKKIIWEG